MRSSFSMSLLYHAYVYLEFLILACTIYILAPMLDGVVNEETLSEVLGFYSTVESLEKTKDYEVAYDTIVKINNVPAVDRLEELVAALDEQIRKLSDSLDIENKKEMEAEYVVYQYKYWVNSQLSIIETTISNARKKAELMAVLSLVKTNRITTEANTLAEALITDAYIVRFSRILKRLAPHLRVKLEKGQSIKGKSPYKVVLDTQDKARKTPQEILNIPDKFPSAVRRYGNHFLDSLLCILNHNFYRNICKDCYAPQMRQGLDKYSHRNGTIIKQKKAISEYRNSDFQISGFAISSRKNIQILSESEQRIVALAAFFADATGRNESTPIIIDDPISSLDYNYEKAATARIIELARERQVIVFTHRISLLVGLSEQSDKAGVAFVERHIRGTLNGKGVSDFEETYHGKISDQLTGIQARIRETKNMDPYSHEYMDSCSRISQQLRICVERSVEDILFQQMVKRFTRRIMTGKLMRMDRITEDDCAIIDSMMTKYSFGEHSQPDDSGLIAMDLDDAIKDIDEFLKWIKEYNKKMNK